MSEQPAERDPDFLFPTPEQETVQRSLQDLARQAVQQNRAYIASTPTAAQSTAQVKALTRQVNALIRLEFGQLDATD